MMRLRWKMLAAIIGLSPLSLMALAETPGDDSDAPQVRIEDRAFDLYVRPERIAAAYDSCDPEALTDVALQLAEGERILQRSSRVLTAEQAFHLAVRAASRKRHQGSFDRLSRFAAKQKNDQWSSAVGAASKLTAANRDTTTRLMAPIDQLPVDDYMRLRSYCGAIDRAYLTGNTRALSELESGIGGAIPAPYQDGVRKMLIETRDSLPSNQQPDEGLFRLLERLVRQSRYPADNYEDSSDDGNDLIVIPPEVVTSAF